MNKIGRNAQCPCGSGLKYKRCCIGKTTVSDSFLDRYSAKCLFGYIAAAQLLPQNSGRLVRLFEASAYFARRNRFGDQEGNASDLFAWINTSPALEDARRAEDPPEGLFTENVCYHGGNYTVYPGMLSAPVFTIEVLTRAVEDASIPETLRDRIRHMAIAMLALSSTIAKRLSHTRWMHTGTTDRRDLSEKIDSDITAAKNAATFDKIEIIAIFRNCGPENFKKVSIKLGDSSFRKPAIGLDSVMNIRPILDFGDSFVVVHPSSILVSLRHYILREVDTEGHLLSVLRSARKVALDRLLGALRLLGFSVLSAPCPINTESFDAYYLKFDVNKVLVLVHLVDPGIQAIEDVPFERIQNSELSKVLKSEISKIEADLDRMKVDQRCRVLIIAASPTGRDIVYSIEKIEGWNFLFATTPDIEALTLRPDVGALDIYRCINEEREFSKSGVHLVGVFGLLDLFSLFEKHGHSFYLCDEKISFFMAPTDAARQYREEYAERLDRHAIALPGGTKMEDVIRGSDSSKEIPIYLPLSGLGRRLEIVVEGFGVPVWVFGKETKWTDKDDAFVACDAVAYWLWQLVPYFSIPSDSTPVLIIVEFDDPALSPENRSFRWHTGVAKLNFSIHISSLFHARNNRKDNLEERSLVVCLIDILAELGIRSSSSSNSEILDRVAPIGPKKKILAFDLTQYPSIAPGVRSRGRRVADFYVSKNLDGLASEVQKRVPSLEVHSGLVAPLSRKEAMDTIKDIYLERLSTLVARFDKTTLLMKLIEENEAIVRERNYLTLTTATSVACYSTVTEKAEYLSKRYQELTAVGLAVRFLIEFVPASGGPGLLCVPDDEFDELVATSFGYINWGMYSEEIRVKVRDHQLAILPTGRFGTTLNDNSRFKYVSIKTHEGVERQVREYGVALGPGRYRDDFENCFREEFGFNVKSLLAVASSLTKIGLDEGGAIVARKLEDLEGLVGASVSLEEWRKVVERLSLCERDSWGAPPSGHKPEELHPWRFTRNLSFMHRPIIKMQNGLLIYGFRQLNWSIQHLLNSISEGSFPGEYFRTERMRGYVAKQAEEKGKRFENTFTMFLKKKLNLRVEQSVMIGPRERFENDILLGDVDCLIVNESEGKIFVIECKDIDPARNAIEMSQEIRRLLAPQSASEKARVQVHLDRVQWVKKNIKIVSVALNLPDREWLVFHGLVTSEEIPTPILRESPTPIIAFTRIEREGLENILLELERACARN